MVMMGVMHKDNGIKEPEIIITDTTCYCLHDKSEHGKDGYCTKCNRCWNQYRSKKEIEEDARQFLA